jgi:hypothetical protein
MVGASEIYVLAGVLASKRQKPTLRELATELHVNPTFVHRALRRAEQAGLYDGAEKRLNEPNFEELVAHSARYIAPVRLGSLTPGVRAAWACPPVSKKIGQAGKEPPPVWPDASARIRGQALKPLHPSAPAASRENRKLAELLGIIDSIRVGDVRVRGVATDELHRALAAR